MIFGATNSRLIIGLIDEFKKIRVLLKEKPDENEEAEMLKFRVKNEKNTPKFYINAVSLMVILLIAITSLLGTL
mgnify:CR=1 FL=1